MTSQPQKGWQTACQPGYTSIVKLVNGAIVLVQGNGQIDKQMVAILIGSVLTVVLLLILKKVSACA